MLQHIDWKRLLSRFFLIYSFLSLPAYAYIAYKDAPSDGRLCFTNEERTPIGSDFIAFYSGFFLAEHSLNDLYNLEKQHEVQKDTLGTVCDYQSRGMPFAYPPPVPMTFRSLGSLEYLSALSVWTILSLTSCLLSFFFIARSTSPKSPGKNILFTLACIATPACSFFTIIGGQASWIGVAVMTSIYLSLRSRGLFLAGLLTSLTVYKPPLFFILFICLFFTMGTRFRVGFLVGASIILGSCALFFNTQQLQEYANVSLSYNYGETLVSTDEDSGDVFHSPSRGRGTFSLLSRAGGAWLNQNAIRIIFSLIVISAISILMRVQSRAAKSFSKWEEHIDYIYPPLLFSSLALSIWVMPYDFNILSVALMILIAQRKLHSFQLCILSASLIIPISGLVQIGDEGLVSAITSTLLVTSTLYLFRKQTYTSTEVSHAQ